MKILTRPLLFLALGFAGCIVVHDNPPPRRVVYTTAPPPAPAPVVVMAEEDEVHYVVYREYFGCTEEEVVLVPHYRRYYSCTDDELYFCWFVSRRCGLSFEVCWRSYYYDCGRSCDRLVLFYRMPREHFFVAVGAGASYPLVYQRSYACYHSGTWNVTFTNQEYVALVHMKVGVEYQGHTSTTYFARVNECGGSTTKVIVQDRDRCGRGTTTVTGVAIQKTAPRPWTMPPQQKQTWQQSHQSQVAKSETSFREVHREQAQKVPPQQPSRPAAGNAPPRDNPPPARNETGRTPAADSGPRVPERAPKAPEHNSEKTPPPRREEDRSNRDKGKEGEDRGKSEKGKEDKGKDDKGKKGDNRKGDQ